MLVCCVWLTMINFAFTFGAFTNVSIEYFHQKTNMYVILSRFFFTGKEEFQLEHLSKRSVKGGLGELELSQWWCRIPRQRSAWFKNWWRVPWHNWWNLHHRWSNCISTIDNTRDCLRSCGSSNQHHCNHCWLVCRPSETSLWNPNCSPRCKTLHDYCARKKWIENELIIKFCQVKFLSSCFCKN